MTDLIQTYTLMSRIREFEKVVLDGAATDADGVPIGEIHGEMHSSLGHEAVAAALAAHWRHGDALVDTHRNHAGALAAGVSPHGLLAEIYERETGICRGRGGHMHPYDVEHNFSASGIVGSQLPQALGYAYAFALDGSDAVAIGATGDGGANAGTFYESLNIAAAWELPLLVLVINNGLAVSTPYHAVHATETVSERAAGLGVAYATADGSDVVDMLDAWERAFAHCRGSSSPYVLEPITPRLRGHYEGDPEGYRTDDQRAAMRDPMDVARGHLIERDLVDAAGCDEIDAAAAAEMAALAEAVKSEPKPDPAEALRYVFTTQE